MRQEYTHTAAKGPQCGMYSHQRFLPSRGPSPSAWFTGGRVLSVITSRSPGVTRSHGGVHTRVRLRQHNAAPVYITISLPARSRTLSDYTYHIPERGSLRMPRVLFVLIVYSRHQTPATPCHVCSVRKHEQGIKSEAPAVRLEQRLSSGGICCREKGTRWRH